MSGESVTLTVSMLRPLQVVQTHQKPQMFGAAQNGRHRAGPDTISGLNVRITAHIFF